jgi:hypothetical protein
MPLPPNGEITASIARTLRHVNALLRRLLLIRSFEQLLRGNGKYSCKRFALDIGLS